MAKITGKQKDFGEVYSAWKTLLEKIDSDGDDFLIFSIKRRREIKYFYVKVDRKYIAIDRAKSHVETAQITEKRRIDFDQFKCVAQLYNDYISGRRGIRPEMGDNCSRNTSYIISLIHHLL